MLFRSFTDEKVNVPVLGIVENMAWFTPAAHPDERYYLFGRDGAVKLSEELKVKLLAQIPIVGTICEGGDSGSPIALNDSITGEAFLGLGRSVVEAVEERNSQLPPSAKVVTHS